MRMRIRTTGRKFEERFINGYFLLWFQGIIGVFGEIVCDSPLCSSIFTNNFQPLAPWAFSSSNSNFTALWVAGRPISMCDLDLVGRGGELNQKTGGGIEGAVDGGPNNRGGMGTLEEPFKHPLAHPPPMTNQSKPIENVLFCPNSPFLGYSLNAQLH